MLSLALPVDIYLCVEPTDMRKSFDGLWAVSTTDGKKLAEYKLDAPPVFDGMAAAAGRLYASTTDGHVVCFGSK